MYDFIAIALTIDPAQVVQDLDQVRALLQDDIADIADNVDRWNVSGYFENTASEEDDLGEYILDTIIEGYGWITNPDNTLTYPIPRTGHSLVITGSEENQGQVFSSYDQVVCMVQALVNYRPDLGRHLGLVGEGIIIDT